MVETKDYRYSEQVITSFILHFHPSYVISCLGNVSAFHGGSLWFRVYHHPQRPPSSLWRTTKLPVSFSRWLSRRSPHIMFFLYGVPQRPSNASTKYRRPSPRSWSLTIGLLPCPSS